MIVLLSSRMKGVTFAAHCLDMHWHAMEVGSLSWGIPQSSPHFYCISSRGHVSPLCVEASGSECKLLIVRATDPLTDVVQPRDNIRQTCDSLVL